MLAPGSIPWAYNLRAEMRTIRLSSATIPESVRLSPTALISLSRSGETLGKALVTDLPLGM